MSVEATIDMLNRAAALMRERAAAATPGPWTATPNCSIDGANRRVIASVAATDLWPTASDAAYIASWHPAVTAYIEGVVSRTAQLIGMGYVHPDDVPFNQIVSLARAYLGETA